MFKDGLLKGKRILITGGGTGLGKEIAARYLQLGAELWLAGRRGPVLEDTAGALMKSHGGKVNTHSVDIRDAAAVDAMVQHIWDQGGPLTGLVNNAAGNFISPTKDLTPNGFNAIANIVFHGTFYVTQALKGRRGIRIEPAGAGRLINQAATLGFSANLAYATTRCETFLSYLRGKEELFNDLFTGDGVYAYEEVPDPQRTGAGAGRALQGFADTILKLFGV